MTDTTARHPGMPADDPRLAALRPLGSYRSDRDTSKLWILPDGTAVSIDRWHYRWILANGPLVARHGLTIFGLPDEEDPVRIAAVRAGFFRGNYRLQDGGLTIEGLESRLTAATFASLEAILAANAERIGWLHVSLFDDAVTAVRVRHAIPWFRLSRAERLDALRPLRP